MGPERYTDNDNIMMMRVVLQPFSVENEMMTQTLIMKRDVVSIAYTQRMAVIYK